MEDLESKCYDKFDFRLEDLQILIAKGGTCNSCFFCFSKEVVFLLFKSKVI